MKKNHNGESKKPTICIIGPGVVGQATGKAFVKMGYKTVFLGGNEKKSMTLRKEGYTAYSRDELFNNSYDYDISMLTVPTPTTDGQINLDFLKSASIDLGKRLKYAPKKYHLVVVKSTVPPGTTEKLVIPLVQKYSGKTAGKDFGVCMNPEYLREKSAESDALKPWVILIGELDKKSGDLLESTYIKFNCQIFRSSLKEAEMQKYVHNLFNFAKISFFNEMRDIGKKMNIDINKVFLVTSLSAEGMWNPQYGTKDFGPFQGSCLPKDTQAFLQWAKGNGYKASLLESIIKVNFDLFYTNGYSNHLTIGNKL